MLIFYFQKIIQYYLVIYFKIALIEQVSKIYQTFASEHKINKSNEIVCTHYRIIGLHSEDICFDTFVVNKCFDFFRNVFNTKVIKVCLTIAI